LKAGGILDTLSGDANKLFLLALTLHDRGESARTYGGARGSRMLPYSLVKRRFKWSPKKISRVFKELIQADALRIASHGGMKGGIREPNVYEIGSAHFWSGKTPPTTYNGSSTATNPGSRKGHLSRKQPFNRLPTPEDGGDRVKSNDNKPVSAESDHQKEVPARLPTPEEYSRSTIPTQKNGGSWNIPEGAKIMRTHKDKKGLFRFVIKRPGGKPEWFTPPQEGASHESSNSSP